MSQQSQDMWQRFEAAAQSAESPDMKALIDVIRIQTEFMNSRMMAIENLLVSLAQSASKITAKN